MPPRRDNGKISRWQSFDPREKGPFGRFLDQMRARGEFHAGDSVSAHALTTHSSDHNECVHPWATTFWEDAEFGNASIQNTSVDSLFDDKKNDGMSADDTYPPKGGSFESNKGWSCSPFPPAFRTLAYPVTAPFKPSHTAFAMALRNKTRIRIRAMHQCRCTLPTMHSESSV
jgi:hypothetical protein